MKHTRKILVALVMVLTLLMSLVAITSSAEEQSGPVAKVGNTEYATIDDAIANWTNNTTLTLLSDVTLSDVIQLSSTEYHVLDLGTYTMTAASGKDAIQIVNNARSSASYALDIKADATNPGGINATGKAIVRTTGKSGVKDRPIIRFYGGVFNASYIVYHSGSNGTNCPQFQFHGGEFNGTIFTNRALNQFYGGVFTGSLMMSVDSSAYTLIKGGTFAKLSNMYMSSLNSEKFTIGSAKGVYDKEVYVDDNGNFVIAATEPSEGIEAAVAKTPGTNDYFAYSKVATEGALNYTDVYTALEKNKTATVTVYVEELDLEGSSFTGTIVVPDDSTLTITNAPEELKVTDTAGNTLELSANGTVTTIVPEGNDFSGYTGSDAIWGETWGNARESFVIKVLDANGNVMGSTTLNNVGGIIDGDVGVTWNLKLDAASNTDEYWTMEWTTAPTVDNMPAKVELWVDGVKVSGGDVVLNGPDDIAKIYAASVDADGKILSYHTNVADAFANGGNVVLLRDVVLTNTLVVPAGKTVVLDLNGKTISQVKNCTASYSMIENDGSLTINGDGKISFTDTGAGDPTASWGVYTIRNAGTLVVNSGTIENLSAQNVAGKAFAHTTLAIFHYSGSTTINGGTISTPNYRSIRLWSGDVTINGGNFVGQVWVHCVNDTADLTINGGSFAPAGNDGSSVFVNNSGYTAALSVTDGTFSTRIGANDVDALAGAIVGGTFTETAKTGTNSTLIAKGVIFGEADENGYYTIEDDPTTLYINNIKDLKDFRDSVNAGTTYKGITVYLNADIDLGNEEWTPIGNSTNKFQGIFDGQDKIISNLYINTPSTSYVGFFGFTTNGEIKNLTIKDAKVTGRLAVGVVAGSPYTSKYTNIKVTGHVEVNGMAYVGGVGGRNAYANWTDITVDVDSTSYVNAISTENGTAYRTYVGGVIGFIGEGGHTFKNITSNIKVIGDVCDIGGIAGIAHYGNNFEGVTFAGSVEAPEGAEEVGGIAGVWHNEKGQTVTFTNVTVGESATVTVGGTDVTETQGVVGGAYNAEDETPSTSGSLIVDGKEAWIKVAKIGDVKYTTLADAIADAKDGETVTLIDNVTMVDGILITDKNITIDLGGFTFTVSEGASTNNRNFKINGASVVTITNGTLVAAGDYSSGAYGTVRTEGNAVVTLEGLKLYNYRGNGLNIKALGNSTVYINNTEIYSQYGGGIEAAGGTIEITNVIVEQKGMYTAPYNSMAISVNGGGKVTVHSGTFSTECLTKEEANGQGTSHGPWVVGVLNSGGTLIINGGTFSNDNFGDNSLATAARGAILADTGANIVINGGTFNALKGIVDIQNNLGDASRNPTGEIKGGIFSADPTNNYVKIAEGCVCKDNGDGTYSVEKLMPTVDGVNVVITNKGDNSYDIVLGEGATFPADGVTMTFPATGDANGMAYVVHEHGGVNYIYVGKVDADGKLNLTNTVGFSTFTVVDGGLQEALNAAAAGSGNVTVEILANIDLTDVDWAPVTVSAPGYPLVTVNGNGKTITGLNDMLFAGTWAGGSGLIINDLTIKDSTIVHDENDAAGNIGVGAFIGFPQASATITLNNCHLVNSTVKGGHWTGGLIGYAAGYAGTDGPVFMNLTIKDCSVTGSVITGKGSAGGVIGHATGNAWTDVAIETTTVSGNTVTSTGSSTNKAGAVVGTIGAAGQATTVNGVEKTGGVAVSATVSGNTVKSNGTTITTVYGRQGSATGMLEIAGGSYDSNPIEENVSYAAPAEGYMIVENTDGSFGLAVDPAYGKVAKIGDTYYETLADAIAAAQAGDEIVLIADVTLTETATLPAGITLNGNGKFIDGEVWASGDLTFVGYTKIKTFNAGYNKPIITIGAGATLETTTGRMVIGHGATFNITGTITDAKTADTADLTPSLIAPGASFTGAGVNFNVTNAYIKFTAYCSSKNNNANGTFNINVTNSVWEQSGSLVFTEPSNGKDPTFNFTLEDSVLNSTSHLVFAVTKGEIVFDNSNVNVGVYRQLENRSTLTIKNGSVVYAAHATSSNAKNPGTTIVENATYVATGDFSGSDVGTGTLIVKSGANVTMGKITGANVVVDATGMAAGDVINLTADLSAMTGTIEVVNNDKLEAKIVDGKIVLAVKPVASISGTPYATLAEAIAAAQAGDTIELLAGELAEGTIKLPAVLNDVTIKGAADHASILKDMTIMASDGNSYSYVGLTFDGIVFDNSRLIFTGWRNGDEIIEDLTVTNCIVKNLDDTTNNAFLHINKDVNEPVKNFTFTNNVLDGLTGGSKSGIYTVNTGKVTITGNTFNNIVFRPALVQLADCDGLADEIVISDNVFSNTTRLQVYGSEADDGMTPIGTDTLEIAITENVFKNISGYYICTWGINGDYDIAKNYYDSEDLGGKIYWNNINPTTVNGLYTLGVYPVYTELNADGTINEESAYTPALTYVAQVGETKYLSLSDAVAAVKANGGTLTLLADANESITFNYPADGAPVEITLELNGFTITSAESTLWVSDGYIVTIKDSVGTGKIISTNAGGEAIAITRDGHVILESGYVYNDFCAVWMYNATNNGTFVMNGGTLEVPNGGQTLSVGAGKATINGGKILCNKIPGGGGWNTLVYANGALEITGGEFLGTVGTNGGPVSISGGTFSYPDDPNDGFRNEHLADGYSTKVNADGSITVYALPTSLQGSGTEEDPYLINNIDDLRFFRDSVNNGNRYNGQFVKLNADIDLNDEEWTPIGDRNVDQGSFLGTFDGGNHTIFNLWISQWNKTGAGFFSKVGNQTEYVSGTVKNLTFENVTIISSQSYVGVIAQAPSGALIDNVHVTGDINISGYGYVGGIVGHGYPTINNSSVIGDGNGTITANYWGAGAILGFSGDYGSHINNATVEGVKVHSELGGAASVTGSPYGAAINGANVKDVVITSNSDYCMGYVSAGGSVANVTATNVTATANGQPITPADVVATIGSNIYFSLEEAFKAATDGCTIEILNDVVVDYKWDCRDYATNGTHSQFKESVTINGNGHTIKFTDTINDNNWNTVFRFEENATVNNLTIDISEATGAQRVISAKKSLTVDGLTIIGSAKYGIIFGEGASATDLAATEIVIENSTLTGTRRAISDNEGGKDVKSIEITDNTLNANVYVSAFDNVTFTGNDVTAGYVDIRSYTADNTLDVTAINNTLTANTETKYNYIEAGGTLNIQDDFVLPASGEVAYRGYIEDSTSREAIKIDLQNVYATTSVVVKLYDANGNLLTTTTLKAGAFQGEYLTTNIVLSGTPSGSWDTVIHAEKLTVANVPTKVELYIDGDLLDTFEPALGNITDAAAYQLPAYLALDCVYKEAKIGDTYYATLAEAFEAAQDGDAIVVLADIATNTAITNTKKVTLDLNGKTITGTDNATGSFGLITNRGELTITDSSESKTGKITLTATNNRGWNAYSSVISNTVGGKLVVENGTIEHLGGTDMAYAIDNLTNGKGTYAETVINGGTIKSTYRAIRQFLNGVEAQNILTVNGGTIEGTNKAIWMQDPSAKANSGTLTVGANAVINGDIYLFVTAGSTEWPVQVSIATSAVNGEIVTGNVPNGYITGATDGIYGVSKDPTKLYIYTLADLIAFRDDVNSGSNYYAGVTVYLAADIDLAGENWVAIGSAYTDHGFMGNFNGNGFKIKNLTITNPAVDSDGYAYAGFFGVTEGAAGNENYITDLVIENVTINTTGHIVAAAIAYPYYTTVSNITVCGNIAIKGGNYTAGVLAYTRRCVNASNITVSGNAESYITGARVVGGVISDIQMNGGLTAVYSNFAVSGVTITGETMVGGISGIIATQTLDGAIVENVTLVCSDARVGIVAGALGGTSTIKNVTATDVIGATAVVGATYDSGYLVVNNGDVYTAVTPVADINGVKYATLEDALAAAQPGDTVTILEGEYTGNLDVNKQITVVGEGTVKFNGQLRVTADGATVKNISFNNGSSTAGYINAKDVTIDGCTVVGGNGFRYCYTSGTVTFRNSTITGSTYGIHFDGNCDGNVVIENCVITGWTSFASTIDKVTISETEFANGNYNQLRFYQSAELNNVEFNPDMTIDFGMENVSADFNGCTVTDDSSLLDVIYLPDIAQMGIEVKVDDEIIVVEAMIGDIAYLTLEEAIAAAQAGDTVTLYVDVTLDAVVTIENAITLDLGDNTVTGADGAIVFNVKAETTIKNGTILGNKTGTTSGLIEIYANLNLDGVTVETSKINALRFKAGDCTATLTNCNVTGAFKGYGASVWNIVSGTYKAASTSINDQLNGTASIFGGTFYYEIEAEECAPGYAVVDNGDGTYGVKYAPVAFVDANNNGTLDDGEAVYGSLEAIFNTYKTGDVYIVLTDNVVIENQVDTDVDAKYYLNTNVAEGVTVEFAFADDWNYVQNMYVGENVTVKAPYLLVWTDLDVYGTIITDYLYITTGDVLVAEGAVVNANTGDATVQVKNGATLTVNGTVNTAILNVWVGESKLVVNGANAEVNASWIDIWDGTPAVSVENGATLDVDSIKASRGGSIAVDNATLDAGKVELGHNGESAGNLTVNNGTVTGEIKLTTTDSTIAGPEGMNVTTDIADHKVVYENGTYKVVAIIYVAEVNGIKYESLADALAVLQANGGTLELLADASINASVVVLNDTVINGNGKKLTVTGAYGIDVKAGVNLAINNLTVESNLYALNLRGASDNAEVTITDSNLTGCIALNVWGKNVVVNATNSTFTSVDTTTQENYSAIALNNNGSYSAENTVINITGGSITALDENGAPSIAIRNATATGVANVSDTTVVTGEIREVVSIVTYNGSDAFYSHFTLQESINRAANDPNATVKLLKDITISEKLVIEGDVIFDGNGKTITYTGTDRAIDVPNTANGANVTIKNLTLDFTGGYSQRGINYNTNGKLILDNVTVNGTNVTYAVNMPSSSANAEVEINNSSITGLIALNVWGANAKVDVINTALTSVDNATHENYAAVKLNNNGTDAAEGAVITITGGSITAKDENGDPSAATTNATATGVIIISDTTTVIGNCYEYVAAVLYDGANEFYAFDSLQEAIEKAENDPKATVKLLKNITISEKLVIEGNVTIDGNGKTITYTGTNRAIEIPMEANGADVTIKNLTVDASNAERGINYNTNGTLTVEKVTVTSTTYAINFPTYADNATVSIKDSKLTSAIALNIWGSDMVITVTDSELYSVENSTQFSYSTIQLNRDEYGNIADGTTVTVTGGKLSALDENGDPSYAVSNWTATGVVTISDTTEVIGEVKNAVAMFGGVCYYTLEGAIEAVAAGGTIILIRDVEISEIVEINKNITIDRNNNTITFATGAYFNIAVGSTLTVDDTEINAAAYIRFGGRQIRYKDEHGVEEPLDRIDIRVLYRVNADGINAWGWKYQLGNNAVASKPGQYMNEANGQTNIVFANIAQVNMEKTVKVYMWANITVDGIQCQVTSDTNSFSAFEILTKTAAIGNGSEACDYAERALAKYDEYLAANQEQATVPAKEEE